MLTLPTTVRVFAATEPVDGRKGIDGRAGVVRAALQRDPLNGDLYLFPHSNIQGPRCSGSGASCRILRRRGS